jgi:hypothetical protein
MTGLFCFKFSYFWIIDFTQKARARGYIIQTFESRFGRPIGESEESENSELFCLDLESESFHFQPPDSPPEKRQKAAGGFFSKKSATHKAVARKKSLPKANNQNLESELNAYSEMNVEEIDSDPLLFWRTNETKFPILSGLSKRYLAAPATSVSSEKLFSVTRDIFDYRRIRLSPELGEKCVFHPLSISVIEPFVFCLIVL